MNKVYNSFFLLIIFSGIFSCTQRQPETSKVAVEEISIIPVPYKLEVTRGVFEITPETKIYAENGNPEAERMAETLIFKLANASGIALSLTRHPGGELPENSILFSIMGSKSDLGPEGYELIVDDKRVEVRAPQTAGLFYGLQTIYQLLPAAIEGTSSISSERWLIPGVHIEDKPRFAWRGLHLDVGRHFMPVGFIKDYLDNMAMHKLNTFHWHLTEDQGWRIEIKKYPRLTEIGAWRKETLVGHLRDEPRRYDGNRYGGYYTQDEIREIVQYAQERFITVVPEIEMPGHARAAIAAYPELGVSGEDIEVATHWGIFTDIFNAEEETFTFLEDVLTEIMELFPGEYIHIGGDEAKKDQWEASDRIQQQIKELGLKDEHELQSYFITRIEKFLNANGRKLIGWDEILEGGLAPNAAVMSWRGTEGGIAAARSGHNVVMTPESHVYFDYYQSPQDTLRREPLAIGGFTPIDKVYHYEPVPEVLSAEEAKHIMGAQANVWTEYLSTPEQVEYMVFPRVSALAEVVWSPKEARDWNRFLSDLPKQLRRYEYKGINFANVPFPENDPN